MKFCFFGDVSNSLKGKTKGGGELQIALLAKALVLDGHQVTIIDPYSKESFITEEGIQLLTVPGWNKGIKGFRLIWYRIPGLYRLLKEQKADYYYGRMRTYFHLLSYLAAKKTKKKFILAIASDIDVLSFRDKYKYEYKANFSLTKYLTLLLPGDMVFKYLIRKSDYIVLQHSGQDVKWKNFKGKKTIFPNIIDKSSLITTKIDNDKEYFVYLGSLTMLKGADKLYQLANIIGGAKPIMIIGQPNDDKSVKIFGQLKEMSNVIIKGRLNHNEAIQLVANAKALINTSNYEGFPNVFLEAWALGVPVISLKVNPGNVFDKYDLGVCCQDDLTKMSNYMINDGINKGNKNAMFSYINTFHDFNTAGKRFTDILSNPA